MWNGCELGETSDVERMLHTRRLRLRVEEEIAASKADMEAAAGAQFTPYFANSSAIVALIALAAAMSASPPA
jgi:hypothetical protein